TSGGSSERRPQPVHRGGRRNPVPVKGGRHQTLIAHWGWISTWRADTAPGRSLDAQLPVKSPRGGLQGRPQGAPARNPESGLYAPPARSGFATTSTEQGALLTTLFPMRPIRGVLATSPPRLPIN